MKKIFILFAVLFIFVGCGKEEVKEEPINNEEEKEVVEVENSKFDGFYTSVIPVFKLKNIESNYYSVRKSLNYTLGKDFYTIKYNSTATVEEASNYYQSLMSEVIDKDEDFFDPKMFSGIIQGHTVNVNVNDLYENSDLTFVSISIGALKEDYVDENWFFDDYPKDLVEIHSKKVLEEQTYEENHKEKLSLYKTIYQTDKEMNEFITYYENLYKDKESFEKVVEKNKSILTWKDKGFDILVKYEISGNYNFVSVIASKPIK